MDLDTCKVLQPAERGVLLSPCPGDIVAKRQQHRIKVGVQGLELGRRLLVELTHRLARSSPDCSLRLHRRRANTDVRPARRCDLRTRAGDQVKGQVFAAVVPVSDEFDAATNQADRALVVAGEVLGNADESWIAPVELVGGLSAVVLHHPQLKFGAVVEEPVQVEQPLVDDAFVD